MVSVILRRVGQRRPMGDAQGVHPPAAHSGPAGPTPPRTAGLRGVDPLVASAYVTTGAGCSFLDARVVAGGGGLGGATPSAYAAGVAMAVVGTALAIATFLAGMARVGSAWASIASSFEPVFTVALGVAVLGDPLGPGKLVGGLAVVAGAVLLPLLSGARETVGSAVNADVDAVGDPMVSSRLKNAATRGSTRR